MNNESKSVVSINRKSFLTAVIILFVLMTISYILTTVVPAGEFDRTLNAEGQEIIVEGTYHSVEGGELAFWEYLAAPILVLGSSDSVTLLAIVVFLLVIGATFNALDHSGALKYMLLKIVHRF
jgi:uncharacterized ion transporter superfamily protein YfcC